MYCMYVYYVCINVCMCEFKYASLHVCIYVLVYIYACIYLFTCTYVYMYVSICVQVNMYVYVRVYARIYVSVYVYLYMYKYVGYICTYNYCIHEFVLVRVSYEGIQANVLSNAYLVIQANKL